MASSVFYAIKEAIIAARKEEGLGTEFEFYAPATAAKIRMACQDKFCQKVKKISFIQTLIHKLYQLLISRMEKL